MRKKVAGLRPMSDFDVLVHSGQVFSAILELQKLAWTPTYRKEKRFREKYLASRHAHAFENKASGHEFDLHWYSLGDDFQAEAVDDFWDGAVSTQIQGVSTCVLNPTDQLLHVCLHGIAMDAVPPLGWIACHLGEDHVDQSRLDSPPVPPESSIHC